MTILGNPILLSGKTLWLYRRGNEFEDVTGGWVTGEARSTSNWVVRPGSKNEDHIYVNNGTYATSPGYVAITALMTSNKIDVTAYKTLRIVCKVTATDSGSSGADIRFNDFGDSVFSMGTATDTETMIQYDISEDTGLKNIWVIAMGSEKGYLYELSLHT